MSVHARADRCGDACAAKIAPTHDAHQSISVDNRQVMYASCRCELIGCPSRDRGDGHDRIARHDVG
jgi:hypothetical protein